MFLSLANPEDKVLGSISYVNTLHCKMQLVSHQILLIQVVLSSAKEIGRGYGRVCSCDGVTVRIKTVHL